MVNLDIKSLHIASYYMLYLYYDLYVNIWWITSTTCLTYSWYNHSLSDCWINEFCLQRWWDLILYEVWIRDFAVYVAIQSLDAPSGQAVSMLASPFRNFCHFKLMLISKGRYQLMVNSRWKDNLNTNHQVWYQKDRYWMKRRHICYEYVFGSMSFQYPC